MKSRFILILLIAVIPAMLSALDCSVCRKKIRGRYLSGSGKIFCSQHCFQSTWPECAQCRKKCSQYLSLQDGRIFCNKSCLAAIYPPCTICGRKEEKMVSVQNAFDRSATYCMACSRSEKCYFCMLPAGNYQKLPDTRAICRICADETVDDPAEVRKIFQQVRADLARDFGFDPGHRIRLNIVDLTELNQKMTRSAPDADGKPMGVMRYTEEREVTTLPGGRKKERLKEKWCRIYVLHTMPRDFLIQTLAHELTHDHLRHRVGEVKDAAAEEGFCELAAALYNDRRGKTYLNRAKEKNPSPIYGEGYRKMQEIYRQTRSFSATMQHVR